MQNELVSMQNELVFEANELKTNSESRVNEPLFRAAAIWREQRGA